MLGKKNPWRTDSFLRCKGAMETPYPGELGQELLGDIWTALSIYNTVITGQELCKSYNDLSWQESQKDSATFPTWVKESNT